MTIIITAIRNLQSLLILELAHGRRGKSDFHFIKKATESMDLAAFLREILRGDFTMTDTQSDDTPFYVAPDTPAHKSAEWIIR